jgi:NADH-quinone oxidoreductase subunit N
MIGADLTTALPEIVLALFAMAMLMVGVYGGKDKLAQPILMATAALMVMLALYSGTQSLDAQTAFNGMYLKDGFGQFAKMLILVSAAVVLVMGQGAMAEGGLLKFEYPILIALSVVGMMLMVSAGDLIALYMGLELQSLALYVVATMNRDSLRSTEAGLKYFILGALASGLLLYGASLTYGYAGTTLFEGILSTISEEGMSVGLLMGLAFMLAGLAFKVSAVPFHMWTPDVYEGAPTPVTAFFATAPKVAAMALIARLVHDAFGTVPGDWSQIVAFLAAASMIVGAIAAIGQRDIKRLMAYSSISHMGFAMVGLAAGTAQGVQAMLVYMAIYITMNIGVFAFILTMRRDGQAVTDISDLNQLSKAEPLRALALLVLMFSLAGVPPLVGFFGKFYVLWAAIEGGLTWLAVIGVVASVIGAFYYLRIVYYMYFGADSEPMDTVRAPVQAALLLASAAIMVLGVINLFGIDGMAALAADALVR